MVYQSYSAVNDGEVTTFIVRGKDTATFRIVSYKMGEAFAVEHRVRRVQRSIAVSIWDGACLEWKEIVPAGIFTYGDMELMQDKGQMLEKVKEFLETFFGIVFSW